MDQGGGVRVFDSCVIWARAPGKRVVPNDWMFDTTRTCGKRKA